MPKLNLLPLHATFCQSVGPKLLYLACNFGMKWNESDKKHIKNLNLKIKKKEGQR